MIALRQPVLLDERPGGGQAAPVLRSPAGVRLGIVASLLPAAFVLLVGVFRVEPVLPPAEPPPQPFPFETVLANYDRLDTVFSPTYAEVEAQIGPPTERVADDQELRDEEVWAEHSHRHLGIPRNRFWSRWSDPQDAGRWFAILFAWDADGECRVYRVVRHVTEEEKQP